MIVRLGWMARASESLLLSESPSWRRPSLLLSPSRRLPSHARRRAASSARLGPAPAARPARIRVGPAIIAFYRPWKYNIVCVQSQLRIRDPTSPTDSKVSESARHLDQGPGSGGPGGPGRCPLAAPSNPRPDITQAAYSDPIMIARAGRRPGPSAGVRLRVWRGSGPRAGGVRRRTTTRTHYRHVAPNLDGPLRPSRLTAPGPRPLPDRRDLPSTAKRPAAGRGRIGRRCADGRAFDRSSVTFLAKFISLAERSLSGKLLCLVRAQLFCCRRPRARRILSREHSQQRRWRERGRSRCHVLNTSERAAFTPSSRQRVRLTAIVTGRFVRVAARPACHGAMASSGLLADGRRGAPLRRV